MSHRVFAILTILFSVFTFTSCPAQTPEQKKFGPDADYYIGLKLLSERNEKEARTKFNHCIKKGSYYCAKKSAEALCTFGNIQEKNQAAENLINTYKDEDSLLIAAKQFESSDEINKVIEYTRNLDYTKSRNDLIRIRINAIKKRGDASYEKEVYKWFTSCPITKEQYQFYRDEYNHPDFSLLDNDPTAELEYTPEQFAINYRIELYKRNYTFGYQHALTLIQFYKDGKLTPTAQLASDLGKSYLYGNINFAANAAFFTQLAQASKDSDAEFYFWFYAGRLYDKAGSYYKKAKSSFESAMYAAKSPEQKDNALWYLLTTSLNFSVDEILNSVEAYSHMWKDPEYFEDFFENLVSPLLASGRWNAFRQIYTTLDGYASDETVAQYAYIYGRLAQQGFADGTEEDIKAAFERACKSGSSVYYKILASYQLGLEDKDLEAVLCAPYTDNFDEPDKNAQILLEGYAAFGFPELIYPTWQEFYKKGIPEETYYYLADFLSRCADETNDYATQGLRIAARGQKMAKRQLTKDEVRQLYPTHYSEFVEKYCEKYDIKESVIYALIRSESFFDSDVTSVAGAIGLTQLMESTGAEMAQRLKIKEYTLTDPETNIYFGTYYLAQLVHRCDDSLLQSFFSYNAGITRVRRWLKSSLIEFGKKSDMPLDLFLETIPYAETREYGRKLVSATTMYEYLAADDEQDSAAFTQIVEKLIK